MTRVTIPIKTESEANTRGHWAVKARRAKIQRGYASHAILASGWKYKGGGVVVELTRIGKRLMDDDNLAGSFKAIRDGIADALGLDDGDRLIAWRYHQRIGRDYAVEIGIEARNSKVGGK